MWLLISILISFGIIGKLHAQKDFNYTSTTTTTTTYNETEIFSEPCIIQSNSLPNTKIDDKSLASSSVIYGLLSMLSEAHVNEVCSKHMLSLQNALLRKEIWAMKVLDSSAQSQPGFIWGNNYWLGSIKGCEAINNPFTLTISNRFPRDMKPNLLASRPPFEIDYRMVYAKHRSPWQIQVEFLLSEKILHIGLCLPTSCSDEEISNLTQLYFDTNLLSSQTIYEHQPSVVLVKDLKLKTDFTEKTGVKILGGFFLLTIFMFIVSAAHDQKKKIESSSDDQDSNNNAENTQSAPSLNRYDDMVAEKQKQREVSPLRLVDKSELSKILNCFSVVENFRSITSTKRNTNGIPIVDGMKSIGCCLILIFHMNWFAHFTVHNPVIMFAYGETTLWQWVSTTPIIVDVFFTISGLLLSYNFLKNTQQIQTIQTNNFWRNCKLFARQLLHRYLRLSPMYLVVIGMTEISTSYLVETSPFWIQERYDQMCQKYWWRNVFYIQNLFEVKDLCLNWTWSMACEMQFFILFSGLLFLYTTRPKLVKHIFVTMFFVFTMLVFGIAMYSKFTPAYDVMHDLGYSLYVAPWTRILPYLIGVVAGYALFTCKNELPLSQKSINLIWAIATTLAIVSHLSTYDRGVSHYLASSLISAIRVFYSTSIAWMIVASTLGHGGLFSKIMNFRPFVHLNKLSYGIYLLNPFVISIIYGLKDHSTHIDPITSTIMSFGVMIVVYLCSFGLSLIVEVPYTRLSSILLKERKTKIN